MAQNRDSIQIKHRPDSSNIDQPPIPGLQSPARENKREFKAENSHEVQLTEVPPRLRKTLSAEEYKGWEQGKILRNISTKVYKVEILQRPYVKTFYFDKNGQRIFE